MFPITPNKSAELIRRMEELGIKESDISEEFIRGSGAGGQKVNKTSSCVVITHRPTGITVRCQRERSQVLNRFFARRELCDRIEALRTGRVLQQDAERSKIRRQKAKRSRNNKRKLVEGKRHRAQIKAGRRVSE